MTSKKTTAVARRPMQLQQGTGGAQIFAEPKRLRASMRQPSTQEIIMLLNEVYIVRDSKNNPAASGVPRGKAKIQGVLAYACYHNLTLIEPAKAEAGEYFRVMVKLTPSAAIKAF